MNDVASQTGVFSLEEGLIEGAYKYGVEGVEVTGTIKGKFRGMAAAGMKLYKTTVDNTVSPVKTKQSQSKWVDEFEG